MNELRTIFIINLSHAIFLYEGGMFSAYFIKQGGEEKCWRCDESNQKKECPNPFHATITNLACDELIMIIMKFVHS
jgi:hypothetical protein